MECCLLVWETSCIPRYHSGDGEMSIQALTTLVQIVRKQGTLEALLGSVIWIISGKPIEQTPFNPEDVVLMLSPETDYFQTLSKHILQFDWYYPIRNGLLLGKSEYPSIPRSMLEDQQYWDNLRLRVGEAMMPPIGLNRFINGMRKLIGESAILTCA